MRFQGVFPIVITPFDENGCIDLDSQRNVVRYLIDSGAHGLGLLANASETYALSIPERSKLMRAIIREVNGRVPVVVSTGYTGTDVAVQLSQEAQQEGADALMVQPPYYVRPDAVGIFHYFQRISEAVSIPIMVQDAPLLTQVTMGPQLLTRMASEIEHVGYVKVEAPPTPPKITEILSLARDSLTLFGGLNGNFMLEELGRGACGIMPGSDMIPHLVQIWNLFQQGHAREARAEFTRCLPLIRYELQPGLGVSVMKHNLKAAGVIRSARVRHPTNTLDRIGVEEVEALMENLNAGWSVERPQGNDLY
jgi:4-hydroxy-tetrahydrodipicolinate synthase